MFRDIIDTPIDPIPVEYTNNIHRLVNEPDYSLTCLGIAMLKDRIPNYNGINGKYCSYANEEAALKDFLERAKEANEEIPYFYYYKFSNDNENDTKKVLTENGFEIKESIGVLLSQKANVKCIATYHKEKNIAAIFIKSSDFRFYHMLISFISLLFPKFFEDKPLADNDYEIIKSLSKAEKDIFIAKIQNRVKEHTIEFRRLMLSGLLRAMHDRKIAQAMNDVTAQRAYLDDMMRNYGDQVKRLKELIVIYEGMKATETYDKPEEDLVDYVANNKLIRGLKINHNRLTFSVATELINYNSDAWTAFANRGYIYDGKYFQNGHTIELLNVFRDKDNRKILLDNIFNEVPEFSVKICGNYCFDLEGDRVMADRNYDYVHVDPVFKTYLPNPHLKLFGCLGGYENRIVRALRERNFIAAIEICCASAGSVDLDETEQTFRPFVGWILSSREKILRRKDGEEMTPEEALIYLIDNKEKTEE